jgi:hypothetical protein
MRTVPTARQVARARKPVRVRGRRPATDILFGVLAVVTLAAVLGGVPYALVTTAGLPVPHGLPPASEFTQQLDLISILRILSVVVWLAWLQLAICVLVEVRAAIRGVGVPARVPLSGRTQSLAHWLVTAALLLFSAGTAIAPVLVPRGPAPAAAPHATSTVAVIASVNGRPAAQLTSVERLDPRVTQAQAAEHEITKKIYVVEPPEGRHHDSLWGIAERHLGDGRRYREIFEMNAGRLQPDGSKLTIASLIRPGWVLDMPHDASGPGIRVVPAAHERQPGGHPREPGAHPRQPAGPAHPSPARSAPARHAPARSAPARPGPVTPPGSSAPGSHAHGSGGAPSGAVKKKQGGQGHGGQPVGHGRQPGEQAVPLIPYELSAAALLAAGVLAALGRQRREQLWYRAFGRRIALPEGDAAAAETALRLGADTAGAQALDAGLRHMTRTLAGLGRRPPAVFAAFISRHYLDLWLCRADPDPPPPWAAEDEGLVWRLPLSSAAGMAGDEARAALAPYPGLVSIGTSEDGRVLIDPGAAGGVISLRGPSPLVRGALAALAVELATSSWSGQLQLTLVGFGAELTLLAPGRVTAVATLDEVLPAMEASAAEMAQVMMAAATMESTAGDPGEPYWGPYWGPDTESLAGQPGIPPPHYLLVGVQPADDQAERLRRLARARYGVAAGCVVAGEVPGAAWTFDIADDGRLYAEELGLELAAQIVPDQQYASVVELFRTAAKREGPALPPAELFAAPVSHTEPGHRGPVEIAVLGPVTVTAPGPIEPARRAFATELVVYVATHPEGVHPAVLTAALWPRGAPSEVAEAAIGRVREWLGTDDVGRPHLGADVSGRLRLGSQVRVDWQVMRAHIARAIRAPGDAARDEQLAQALTLVRGQLLEGHDRSRYTWLATDGFEAEVTAWVADTAHQLARMRLAAGDAQGAMEAARGGLKLAGGDETLWRDLLRAAHATGWEHVLRDVVREISARVAIDPVLPRMAPETEALIDELMPLWRHCIA